MSVKNLCQKLPEVTFENMTLVSMVGIMARSIGIHSQIGKSTPKRYFDKSLRYPLKCPQAVFLNSFSVTMDGSMLGTKAISMDTSYLI